jgi:geranylgeranyl pyrophosphate synthase
MSRFWRKQLGMAFQITGRSHSIITRPPHNNRGKPTGIDLREHKKNSSPLSPALRAAMSEGERNRVPEALFAREEPARMNAAID